MPSSPLVSSTDYGVPVIRLDLRKPPAQRWLEAGEEHAPQIRDLVATSWDEVLPLLPHLPPAFRWLSRGISPLGDLSGRVASLLGADYSCELRGLARASGIPYGQLFLLNLSYDLFQILGLLGGACSSASYTDGRGRPILARNMDWNLPETLGRHTCIVEVHNRGLRYRSVSVLGFVGVLSAMRDQAWAITLNQAPCLTKMVAPLQFPACMHLRNVCDTSTSFHALRRNIGSWRAMTPYFVHLVGVARDEQALIQNCGSHYWDFPGETPGLAQTNHYLDPDEGELLNEQTGWGSDCDRLTTLQRRLRRTRPRTLADGYRLLAGEPVTNEATMQQMVLRPATGTLRLRVRP